MLEHQLQELLQKHNLHIEDIDYIMLGEDGDERRTPPYTLVKKFFNQVPVLCFKHLCGEYDTAANFGVWLCTQILRHQSIPKYLHHPESTHDTTHRPIKLILLYNNYFEQNQSLMLLGIDI
jgi:3-oxoacyl-(acyl-carrier-protein) synthase